MEAGDTEGPVGEAPGVSGRLRRPPPAEPAAKLRAPADAPLGAPRGDPQAQARPASEGKEHPLT